MDDGARVFALDTHLQYTYTVMRGISKIVANRRELIQIFTMINLLNILRALINKRPSKAHFLHDI